MSVHPSSPDSKAARWWHFWQCDRCTAAPGDTRQRLLEAALEEIHRVGFQAASLHRILRQAGVTKGALYHHFASKQALGYAVVDELIAPDMHRLWLEPLVDADDPVERFKRVLTDISAQMTATDIELGCPLNNLAQEMAPVDEGFRQRIQHLFDAWRRGIAEALTRGQAAGNVRGDIDVEATAIFIVATLEGCVGLAKTSQSLDLLHLCGAGLTRYLDSLKP